MRFSQLTSPAYSIKSKGYSQKNQSATTPSPLDYQSSDVAKSKVHNAYSFGFGSRTPFKVKTDSPPPNKYSVPTTIGDNVSSQKNMGKRGFGIKHERMLKENKNQFSGA